MYIIEPARPERTIICRLGRLGRSVLEMLNLVHVLDARDASLCAFESDVTTAAGDRGRMVITVLGTVCCPDMCGTQVLPWPPNVVDN